jgi:CzcA family heavy metal efflux pump
MLQHRLLLWLSALALASAGALSALGLPSGIYPAVEFPRIVVVARCGDAPPDVTQSELTRPLETALATVLGVERIRSKTIRGSAELSLQFAPNADMWRALQLVESRVAEIRSQLPAQTEISVERLTTTSFPIVTYNVSGPLDPRRLRELAELVLKPAVSQVRGVGKVEILGGDEREIEVVLDPEKTAALHLSATRVAEVLKTQTERRAVGRLDQAHSAVTILASAEVLNLDDLRQIPVAVGPAGSPVVLESIAQVTEGAQDRLLAVSGPAGETVLMSISSLPGTSAPDVILAVNQVLTSLKNSLPAELLVTPVYDQASLVTESIHSVRDAIGLGILLCVGVIAVFLRNGRAGLVAALSIPLTIGMTFLAMQFLGQSLNLMSLGGLAVAIGLVIDDAIVMVEGIGRNLEHESPSIAIHNATKSLFAPLLGTTLTTVVVFLPLSWLEGMVGRFFSALAITLSAAVLISLVVAVTIIPLAAHWLLRAQARQIPAPSRLSQAYEAAAAYFLRRPIFGLILCAALLGLGGWSGRHLQSGFLPEMDEGAFVLDYFLPAGTSLSETNSAALRVEALLKAQPEVLTFSRRTGAELGPAAATLVNRGDMMVRLRPAAERSLDSEEVITALREAMARETPEVRVEFVQVLQDVLNDLSGAPRPIEIKIFGDDYGVLHDLARSARARLEDTLGLVDLYPGFEGPAPTLRFRMQRDALIRNRLSATEVATELDTALHGTVVAQFRRADKPIGIRVRYPDSTRFHAQQILQVPVITPDANLLRLLALVTPEYLATETSLTRESLRPVVILTADHEGRDLGSLATEVASRLHDMKLPPGYRLEIGGQVQSQKQTFRELFRVMAFGVVAVVLVLLLQFRRAHLAFAILASVPLSLVGAAATLWLTNVPLNASSLMGCILLVGLVVKNGILLLEQYEVQLEKNEPPANALISAGNIRLRPILMTTLATLAGLAPLAFNIGPGAEIQRPLAIAVMGGLLVSTFVSLLLLPTLVNFLARDERASEKQE